MPNLFLSKPKDIYKKSYISALEEFQKEGINLKYDKSELNNNFEGFIRELNELESNPKLEFGRVIESVYWLIDKQEFIGKISIRHTLNPYLEKYDGNIGFEIRPMKRKMGYGSIIFQLGIKQAKILGLSKILIMCKETNIASIKIIEKNSGILLDKYYLKIEGEYICVRKYVVK